METIFQRVLVTTISCSNPRGGQDGLSKSKSNVDAQPSRDGDLNDGHPQSITLVCEVDVYPGEFVFSMSLAVCGSTFLTATGYYP